MRRNWILLGKATVVWATTSAVVLALLSVTSPASVVWFASGALATSYFWLIAKALDSADGTALRRLGGEAERWVSDDLRRMQRSGWVLIDHVPFADGDVDHVLIGPGGAWAVETKRSSTPVVVGPDSISGVYGGDPCYQARRGAKRIAGLLRPLGISVRAAVVLAGPGAPETEDGGALVSGGEYDDVLVLNLRTLSKQLHAFTFTTNSDAQVEQARSVVEGFVRRRDQHEKTRAKR